jgi:hypothetical protein
MTINFRTAKDKYKVKFIQFIRADIHWEVLMKPNIFMSYSRREVPFVNALVDDLEDQGFNVWLDYRSLIPGTPWAEQIDAGITESEVILLVVSKASMASKYVEMEWQQVIKLDKRVILLIFEAVDLPIELECYEWVDFRGNYKAGLEELARQLQQSEEEEHPAPKKGFKVPIMVWIAAVLSVVVAVLSLGAIWTLFIPYILIPLPYRIFKRDFNFTQVQASLVMLPVALFMTTTYVESDSAYFTLESVFLISLPIVIMLFFILRSPYLQRWGKPVATLPKFANRYNPDNPNPEPIPFYVDHAPQDRVVAEDLSKTLVEYGHPQVAEPDEAKAVFAVVSRFKTSTAADPQKQVVYPVILQTTDEIDEKLSKVQWIDYRHGVRNLDALAQLLPDPEKLLKALGIRPMGDQLILPSIIQYLIYFIIALAVFTVGSWLPYIIQFLPDIIDYSDADTALVGLVVNLVIFVALSIFMTRVTVQRRQPWASHRNMFLVMLGLGFLILWQVIINETILDVFIDWENENDLRGFSAYFPPLVYIVGNFIMLIFVLRRRADMRRWFPARR